MFRKSYCIILMGLVISLFMATNSIGQIGGEWTNVIFSEDFEDGSLAETGWTPRNNATIEKPEVEHSGNAAKFESSDGISRADVISDSNEIYIAFWMLQTDPADNAFTLYHTTQGAAAAGAAANRMNFKVVQEMFSPVADGWGDPNAEMGVGIDIPIKADTWHQVGVAVNYSKGTYKLYFDNMKTAVVEDVPFRDKNGAEEVYFIVWEDEPHEGTVYLDDIVVGEGPMPNLAVSSNGKLPATWGTLKMGF